MSSCYWEFLLFSRNLKVREIRVRVCVCVCECESV